MVTVKVNRCRVLAGIAHQRLSWQHHKPCNHGNSESEQVQGTGWYCSPKAPPISAPLVGMLTLTMPQSEPFGLHMEVAEKVALLVNYSVEET